MNEQFLPQDRELERGTALRPGSVLAVIPARGGSKGLPRKNARILCGKPLVAYSIEAALQAKLVTRVVVSTDDDEIADIARAYGPDVPLMRPAELATDTATIGDTIAHAHQVLAAQGFHPDFTVTLYPSHPFRAPGLIDRLTAVGLSGIGEVITVRPVEVDPLLFHAQSQGVLAPLRREQGPTVYYRPYGLYAGNHNRGGRGAFHWRLEDCASLVDIDTMEDFLHAEKVIEHGLLPLPVPDAPELPTLRIGREAS